MRKELIFVVLVACTKDAAPAAATKELAVDAALPLPVPQAGVPSVPSVATVPSASSVPAVASGRAVPSGRPAVPVAPVPSDKVVLQPASAKVTGNHFAVDVASAGCVVGSECAVTVRLEATGGYHINKEYPYKLALSPTPNVEFLGRDPGGVSTFSKSAGDFVIAEEHVATMTARLKPSAKGTASITGIYKMSVCSDANCQIEQTKIALDVAVQ
jgi:hypothetical protein